MQDFSIPSKQAACIALWAQDSQRSLLRRMVSLASKPGITSMAGGLPDPQLFPRAEFADAMQTVLLEDLLSMQYGPTFKPLQRHIVKLMARRGMQVEPESVFITTGAQQAIDVLARLLVDPGEVVVLESTIYTGIKQALAPFQPRILTVSTDLRDGFAVNELAQMLAAGVRPALVYVIPESHNPLGVSMSLEKRRQLAALASQYHFPIIEDDAYGLLNYAHADSPPIPTLHQLNPDWGIYVGSFSKIIAPALRLGWMVAPQALRDKIALAKEACDLETSALTQRAVAAYLSSGHFEGHLTHLRQTYCTRRDAMLAALDRHFPATCRWTHPKGGMFVWVEMPQGFDSMALLNRALDEVGVAFVPGVAFAVNGKDGSNSLRLSFATVAPEKITDGIERLGRVIRSILSQPPNPPLTQRSI